MQTFKEVCLVNSAFEPETWCNIQEMRFYHTDHRFGVLHINQEKR